MKAFVFPGQGAQFVGMGHDLYKASPKARARFKQANEILGFDIAHIMFDSTEEELMQTKVTQPAVFLHSVIACEVQSNGVKPAMVAGHSLGEYSALVANGTLEFEDALRLVLCRALAMQKACEYNPSTMAVVLGAPDEQVEAICRTIDDVVLPANYNCPGQLVISGTLTGIDKAIAAMRAAGIRKILPLKVGGAFHSPLMASAQEELATAIQQTPFHKPFCPIYQNKTSFPSTNPEVIKQNLIEQLTSPVMWTQSVRNMAQDGAYEFFEFGPGEVLQGLIKRIVER